MQSKINALLNHCYEDTDKPGIEFQLFLISVKCLMPYEEKIGCFFDVERYKKEIELFAHYKNGEDNIIDHWIKEKVPSNKEDNLLEYKIIPIILVNTVWDNLIEEVFKSVVFYTLNKNTILNSIFISSLIYEYMNNNSENAEDLTKERLINFSVKDFFIKNNKNVNKSHIIDFEKERIKMLSDTDRLEYIKNYKSLEYIFGNTSEKLPKRDTIDSFSAYLFKLRKGTIDPEKLKISSRIPDLTECLKRPLFNHPLLGRCKVLKRTVKEVIVENKSGIMRIRI